MKEFPQVARSSSLADQLYKFGQQFGMTASARAALGAPMPKPDKDKNADGKRRFFTPKLIG